MRSGLDTTWLALPFTTGLGCSWNVTMHACAMRLRTVGIPAPPDDVGDGRMHGVVAAAGQVHVLGHVRQHADVGSLCAPYAQHEGSRAVAFLS